MDRNFGGVIWTNHALDRLRERDIKQGDAWTTWRNPDKSNFAKIKGAWVYYKTFGSQTIEVVAKQNELKEWIVLSVWSRATTTTPTNNLPLLARLFKKLFRFS